MSAMKIRCAHCGKISEKRLADVNRANAAGLNIYCDRRCSGLGRRTHKTKAQKVIEKRAYDIDYRRKNLASIRAKKAAHFKLAYDPVKAAVERKKRMAFHVEYCRRPSYRLWKREYDRRYRAREYGPFADAYQLTVELNREIKTRSNDYEIRQANQTGNKAQKRKRDSGQNQKSGRPHSPAYG